ncbi:MAG: helix-turn-helix transcriptional regulator [Lachnospiraceae bacterium]|nr:helix-turn-helix transcriptional regulator [Lachnospiraceae bacterium]
MYRNLIEVLNKKGITMKAYAELLGVTEKTIQNKIQGKTDFTLEEVKKTCNIVCSEYRMEYVFSTDNNSKQIA